VYERNKRRCYLLFILQSQAYKIDIFQERKPLNKWQRNLHNHIIDMMTTSTLNASNRESKRERETISSEWEWPFGMFMLWQWQWWWNKCPFSTQIHIAQLQNIYREMRNKWEVCRMFSVISSNVLLVLHTIFHTKPDHNMLHKHKCLRYAALLYFACLFSTVSDMMLYVILEMEKYENFPTPKKYLVRWNASKQ
jgi:hypothetical protein